jgi:hypothetical protein
VPRAGCRSDGQRPSRLDRTQPIHRYELEHLAILLRQTSHRGIGTAELRGCVDTFLHPGIVIRIQKRAALSFCSARSTRACWRCIGRQPQPRGTRLLQLLHAVVRPERAFELHSLSDAGIGGAFVCDLDRLGVIVRAAEGRLRICSTASSLSRDLALRLPSATPAIIDPSCTTVDTPESLISTASSEVDGKSCQSPFAGPPPSNIPPFLGGC